MMPADKELFETTAILTAISFQKNAAADITEDGIMAVFDRMYDYLDCYRRHKNEKEPMGNIREWLKTFYEQNEEARPRFP